MADIATALLGKPNPRLSTRREWRYGRRGSLAIRPDAGTWYDHETGAGGGTLALIERELGSRAAALDWAARQGFISPARGHGALTQAERDKAALAREAARIERAKRQSVDAATSALAVADARRRWDASTDAVDGTAAHDYLARRLAWPPASSNPPALPDDLRFNPRAGEIIYAYRSGADGRVVAVQCRRIDSPHAAAKTITYGRLKRAGDAAVFRARHRPGPAILTEGNEDALAACWLTTWAAYACGGTARMTAAALMLARTYGHSPIWLAGDEDKAGRTATFRARDALHMGGFAGRLYRLPVEGAKDANDALAAIIRARRGNSISDAWAVRYGSPPAFPTPEE